MANRRYSSTAVRFPSGTTETYRLERCFKQFPLRARARAHAHAQVKTINDTSHTLYRYGTLFSRHMDSWSVSQFPTLEVVEETTIAVPLVLLIFFFAGCRVGARLQPNAAVLPPRHPAFSHHHIVIHHCW